MAKNRIADLSAYLETCNDPFADHKCHPRERVRRYVWRYKLEHPCECGQSHPAALTFHHLDPSQKVLAVASMAKQGYSFEHVVAEIAKCKVICMNCHAILNHEQLNASSGS